MSQAAPAEEQTLLTQFRHAVADDLRTLAWLQSQELTQEVLANLRQVGFPTNLGFRLQSPESQNAFEVMQQAIAEFPEALNETVIDDLAADFAAIYLNSSLRTSPYESVWLSDDHLMRQKPMFQVREWYVKYDLQAKDWRNQPDDHLALQLEFVAHLLTLDDNEASLQASADFLDEHLLRWITQFASQVANRCHTLFYAGLTVLMAQYLEELRETLAHILGQPRPSEAEIKARMKQKEPVVEKESGQEVEWQPEPGPPGWS